MAKTLPKRIGALVALVAVLASCSLVTPVTGPGTIGLPSFDLSQVGYQRSETFLTGLARSYSPTAPLTNDGRWTVAAAPTLASFKTRMVTFRPIDPARFNGTVVVEWLNVSAGGDLPTDWIMAHNEFIRRGAAYVAVSAQVVGVDALKNQQPDRYGSLVHPGDSYSYDIFSEAGKQVRANPNLVLGGLTPQRVIATLGNHSPRVDSSRTSTRCTHWSTPSMASWSTAAPRVALASRRRRWPMSPCRRRSRSATT